MSALKYLRFRLSTWLFCCMSLGIISAAVTARLMAVIHVSTSAFWLEQHGAHVFSDFKDRYGLFPADRNANSRGWFEWALAAPRDISVAFSRPQYVSEIVERVSKLPTVRTVNLTATALSEEDVKQLTTMANLRELSLAGTPVNDAMLDSIQQLPQLRVLDLSETAVTNAGLAKIASMRSLQFVNLNKTQVTPRGMWELRRARPDLNVSPRLTRARNGHRRPANVNESETATGSREATG